MKKKNFCLLLCLVLALSLILMGCGSDTGPVSGNVTPGDSTAEPTSGGDVQPEDSTTPEDENPLSLGRMEGGVYTNKYAGFACSLDTDWTFYSADELQELPGTVSDMMSGSELGDALEGMQQLLDMMAENVNDLTAINILYQKLSMQERLAYALMDDGEIVDSSLAQEDMLIEAYQQAGIEVISLEKVTVTFLGEERVALKMNATIQGTPYYTLQLFEYHLGEYGVTITLSSYVEDTTESLLELFYKVD